MLCEKACWFLILCASFGGASAAAIAAFDGGARAGSGTDTEDATSSQSKDQPAKILTYKENELLDPAASYRKLALRKKCPKEEQIKSEGICQKAASELGLMYADSLYNEQGFPGCYYAVVQSSLTVVVFNGAANGNGNPPNQAGICLVGADTGAGAGTGTGTGRDTASYRKLGDGEKCPTGENIRSEEICKKAASELGLTYETRYENSNGFPACHFAKLQNKNRVIFNPAPNANGDNPMKSGICLGASDGNSDTAHYKEWGSWGRCTEPCDGGEQTRYRECEGPKELCEHRIVKEDRECNTAKCRFPKREEDGVKYYETDDGMCLSDLSREDCSKIAKALKYKNPDIINKDHWFFPHGCYHSVDHDYVFYNEKPSTKRCDAKRKCLCRIALGKEQLVDWVFGDPAVNPGKSSTTRKDFYGAMVEEKYIRDSVKKNEMIPGDNLYELMDEM